MIRRVARRPETLLVNYWYAHPVGHAIEGLRYALGYHAANPELRISLLLNGAAPAELARCCSFLAEVYAVPFTGFFDADGDPVAALAGVPRTWDYVVEHHSVHERSHDQFVGFRAFFNAARAHLHARRAVGVAGAQPPAYLPHQQLRLDPPTEARLAAQATIGDGRKAISVVLAGSSAQRHLYPSITSWELILSALSAQRPDATICLIGKLADDGRTTTRVGRAEIDRLLSAVSTAIDCFDRPLLEQLALIEASDLLVSPHTGFAFLASTVETPWLAISGGNWHEYFFNGVPVYSLLPNPDHYPPPAWAELGPDALEVLDNDEDGEGPRTPTMSAARIRNDLPELLEAADLLIEKRLSYEQALTDYFPRLLATYHGERSRVFSFDRIHERYLP
jgi:hypothetical protein